MRDVLRANVYGRGGLMVWSSDASLIGRSFSDNDELEEAMAGELVVHAGRIDDAERAKPEHEGLSHSVLFFVETYIPVRTADGTVVGAVELYKAPLALTEAIHQGRVRVALVAIAGGLVLFLGLFGLIRRADRIMRAQHAQLIEAQTALALGELAASVAHNIRNPLASIRSAAELCLDDPAGLGAEQAREILQDVDRVSARITELLRLSAPGPQASEPVPLGPLLQGLAAEQGAAFERRGHRLLLQPAADLVVRGDAGLLGQVLRSLLANAREALPDGTPGWCLVRVGRSGKSSVRIEIEDSGPGMAPEVLEQVFRPFFTTKPQGLGLGLPLARRIVERMGGRLLVQAASQGGTTVRIELPGN
jgi:signal transduction histidine kinase